MKVCRKSSWLVLLFGLFYITLSVQGTESDGPSESECRPYIEKALKELETSDTIETKYVIDEDTDTDTDTVEDIASVEEITEHSHVENDATTDQNSAEYSNEKDEVGILTEDAEPTDDDQSHEEIANGQNFEDDSMIIEETDKSEENTNSSEEDKDSVVDVPENLDLEEPIKEITITDEDLQESIEEDEISNEKESIETTMEVDSVEDKEEEKESIEERSEKGDESVESIEAETDDEKNEESSKEVEENMDFSKIVYDNDERDQENSQEHEEDAIETKENIVQEDNDNTDTDNTDLVNDESVEEEIEQNVLEADYDGNTQNDYVEENESVEKIDQADVQDVEPDDNTGSDLENDTILTESKEISEENTQDDTPETDQEEEDIHEEVIDVKENETEVDISNDILIHVSGETTEEGSDESAPEEDLINEDEVPADLRPRDHIGQLLKLDDENEETEKIINSVADITLKDLKKLYENAIKPLEVLYKYRDLSNRHFGDSEIFSKPLVLFMGPWSGGKSSIINYLIDNEYKDTSLRTGAEPSPAFFNILMYGDEPEILDGTQLAADYTFSGLQKFGQGLEERLRGYKLQQKILEKINVVEIPGILEVRKQVSRIFPFNDACQWFIDRADIIFLVYDPSKLDVGPETEAILDQLKGREHQTRIILNKADQVKPEELMRVQGALIWNISPLMSSAQPPIMYTTSLWSRPYETWAPVRLLQAQERALLRDLRSAVDKRIENKIASARRFAVRVRNHAKMVDCYLTTYYNHKSVFGNRKQVSDAIIERPQDYHIYEGLSTLTNISRYDLPDPEVYRDFFRLNPLYEFQQLSATCTYFRGCPINRLDVAIAYDLPELVGRHKRTLEAALAEMDAAKAQTQAS